MSLVASEHISYDIRSEESAAATSTATTSTPTTSGPTSINTLSPDATFSDTPERPYKILSIFTLTCPWMRLPHLQILNQATLLTTTPNSWIN